MSYVNGDTIKKLREKKGLTQKELGEILNLSDKTISKWETQRGLPDINILTELATALSVSLVELMTGELKINKNSCANMKKTEFYVCPVCGNVIESIGSGSFSCCGITLPKLEAEEFEDEIKIETIENEYYISINHSMTKKHYISFIALVTSDTVQLKKLYSEQEPSAYFAKNGRGTLYYYCNRHGLFSKNL